jgi:putative membrane protein
MIVFETILRRWYVFAFLAAFFAASVPERGWKATLRFAMIAFGLAFAAEYTSTRTGFPFTSYRYTAHTRGDEVYLSNIPLIVPLSYAVMIYGGRSLGSRLLRRPSVVGLVVAGAIATVALDVVVDPVALRGPQWFLGPLFRYDTAGQWFGVPLGNFGGWLLVAAMVIALDLALSRWRIDAAGVRGSVLAGTVVAFNFTVGLAIGAVGAALASLGLAIGILLTCGVAAGGLSRLQEGVPAARAELPSKGRRKR